MDAFSAISPALGFQGMTGAGIYSPTMDMGMAANRLQGPAAFNPMAMQMNMMNQQMMLMEMMMMMLMELMLNNAGGGAANPFAGGSSNGNWLGGGFSPSGGGGGSNGSSSAGGASGGGSQSGGSESGPISTGPVAPGVGEMLKHAGSMVGLNENRDTAAIQKITGESGINPAKTPWCAAFAINMLKDHGVLDTAGLSNPNYCPTIKSWAQGKHIFGDRGQYTPKPGDAILFDWEGDGTDDHIGIVEKVENGKVYTIEGNSSDSVKRNVYDLGSGKIDGYVVTGKK